jgi:hypothetical protein
MRRFWCGQSLLSASLLLLFMCAAGCSGYLYNWQIRTTGTPVAPSFDQTPLAERPVAIFPALPGRTASQYTYLKKAIDTLVRESIPVERKDGSSGKEAKEKQ